MKVTVEKQVLKHIKTATHIHNIAYQLCGAKNIDDKVGLSDMYFAILLNNAFDFDKDIATTKLNFRMFLKAFYMQEKYIKSIEEEVAEEFNKHNLTSIESYEKLKELALSDDMDATKFSCAATLYIYILGILFARLYEIENVKTFIGAITMMITNEKSFSELKKGFKKKVSLSEELIAYLVMPPFEIVANCILHDDEEHLEDFKITNFMISYVFLSSDKFMLYSFEKNAKHKIEPIYEQGLATIIKCSKQVAKDIEKKNIDFVHLNSLKNLKDRENSTCSEILKEIDKEHPKEEIAKILYAYKFVNDKFMKEQESQKYEKDFNSFIKKNNFIYDMFEYIDNKDKVILGRDEEVKDTLISLSKKTKSNIILIGEPGTGKTAIVEELARAIKYNEIPKFVGYRVIEFNVTSLVAGTKYRGQLEEKLDEFIKFVSERKDLKLILFIDEIHKIMGAGSTEESPLDVSNMLKPLLARDNIRMIGATTNEEYDKYICRDKAIMRRFDTLKVKEPEKTKVYDMISAKIDILKKYHDVSISQEDIDFVIDIADKKIKNRYFPDKALDIIDYCMAETAFFDKKVFDKDFVINYVENIKEDDKVTVGY